MITESKAPGWYGEEEEEGSLQPPFAAAGNEEGWRGKERCPNHEKELAKAPNAFLFQPSLKRHLRSANKSSTSSKETRVGRGGRGAGKPKELQLESRALLACPQAAKPKRTRAIVEEGGGGAMSWSRWLYTGYWRRGTSNQFSLEAFRR